MADKLHGPSGDRLRAHPLPAREWARGDDARGSKEVGAARASYWQPPANSGTGQSRDLFPCGGRIAARDRSGDPGQQRRSAGIYRGVSAQP